MNTREWGMFDRLGVAGNLHLNNDEPEHRSCV